MLVSASVRGGKFAGETRPRLRRVLLSRAGQIAIPALFIVPTFFLFIYLLFETAKLSREKIRHQFAVDSAAFIHVTNASDLLNRTAYVNGPFPYRIFYEIFMEGKQGDPQFKVQGTGGGEYLLYDLLYNVGAFPGQPSSMTPDDAIKDSAERWRIRYADGKGSDSGDRVCLDKPDDTSQATGMSMPINRIPLSLDKTLDPKPEDCKGGQLQLFVAVAQAFEPAPVSKLKINYNLAQTVANIYKQIYELLGSIEDSQIQVYQKITEDGSFYKKSYYLNTGEDDAQTAGIDGATQLADYGRIKLDRKEIQEIMIAYRVPQLTTPLTGIDVVLPDWIPKTGSVQTPKLFQLAIPDSNTRSMLSDFKKGKQVFQTWTVPSNYFNVDFNRQDAYFCRSKGKPCVHATVAMQCPGEDRNNNCIWPDPTPKYQVRLYP